MQHKQNEKRQQRLAYSDHNKARVLAAFDQQAAFEFVAQKPKARSRRKSCCSNPQLAVQHFGKDKQHKCCKRRRHRNGHDMHGHKCGQLPRHTSCPASPRTAL